MAIHPIGKETNSQSLYPAPGSRKLSSLRFTPYASRIHLPILLILLLAFFLRAYHLDAQALRGDEAATVHYSAMPITELWELSRVTDPHPPLFYLMLHPWQWLMGESAWIMRFAGVTASVLTVAALYTLARLTLPSTTTSLLAAALITVNPLQIWLAQDVRSYPFFTLFGLLSSWALWSALNRPTRRISRSAHASSLIPWLLYILLTVACFYTHYYTIFLMTFQALFVLLNIKKFWFKKWPWLVSQVAISLFIIPALLLARNLAGEAAGGIDTIPTAEILRLASTALLTGFTLDASRGLWVSFLLAPVWIIGLVSLLRRNVTSGVFWGLFFAVPVLSVIVLSIGRPFFKERFLVQAQPAFELFLAAGFVTLWQAGRPARLLNHTSYLVTFLPRLVAILLFAALLYFNLHTLSNYFTNPAYAKSPPWQLYRDYVSSKARPNDVMLTNFPEAAISYYSPNQLPFYVVPVERDRPVAYRLKQTEQIAGAYRRIWFLPMLQQGFDEEGAVLHWLDRHADRVDQTFFPAYHVNLYLSPPAIDATLIPQPVTFAHGLHLRGYQVFDEAGDSRLTGQQTPLLTLEPGDEFTLSLSWHADGPTPIPYTVFTHLIAADGFNQTGRDNQPVWGTYPTTTWTPGEKVIDKYTLALPESIPPGNYWLHLGWYQSATLERVPVLDEAGQPGEDHVVLSMVVRVAEN
ncbi:MAG: glycosyltransferase family 39 protein [Anaerolineae bacterium]|nr:glycosyltransferase family 39 protein [Anaerolineae bacterium]